MMRSGRCCWGHGYYAVITLRVWQCRNHLLMLRDDTLALLPFHTLSRCHFVCLSVPPPPPCPHRCVFKEDVLLINMGFGRPFGQSVAILLGYLGALHVLTYAGLLLTARRERR